MTILEKQKKFRESRCAELKADLNEELEKFAYWDTRSKHAINLEDHAFSSDMRRMANKRVQRTKRWIKRWSEDPTTTKVKQSKNSVKPKNKS